MAKYVVAPITPQPMNMLRKVLCGLGIIGFNFNKSIGKWLFISFVLKPIPVSQNSLIISREPLQKMMRYMLAPSVRASSRFSETSLEISDICCTLSAIFGIKFKSVTTKHIPTQNIKIPRTDCKSEKDITMNAAT